MVQTYRKAIKFYYYKALYNDANNNEYLFNFPDWITTINNENITQAIVDAEEYLWSIEKIYYNSELRLWVCSFNRARDNNIPQIIKSHIDSRPIELADDEYLGEGLHILFDESHNIFMIQNNRFSLSVKQLEQIFSKFTQYPVSLYPILDNNGLKKAENGDVKSFEVAFANLRETEFFNNSGLSQIINSFKIGGAKRVKLIVSAGRKKKVKTIGKNGKEKIQNEDAYLDDGRVRDIINFAQGLGGNLVSGSIKVKPNDSTTIEKVDLFENIANSVINMDVRARESLNFNDICGKMIEDYLVKRDSLLALLNGDVS